MPNAPPFFGTLGSYFDYGIVRYSYKRSNASCYMSQVMTSPRFLSNSLIQDVFLKESETFVESTTKQIKCCVCNKGLGEGFSVTAKNTSFGTAFFCEIHYSN